MDKVHAQEEVLLLLIWILMGASSAENADPVCLQILSIPFHDHTHTRGACSLTKLVKYQVVASIKPTVTVYEFQLQTTHWPFQLVDSATGSVAATKDPAVHSI